MTLVTPAGSLLTEEALANTTFRLVFELPGVPELPPPPEQPVSSARAAIDMITTKKFMVFMSFPL
jgi:hypothetical protein